MKTSNLKGLKRSIAKMLKEAEVGDEKALDREDVKSIPTFDGPRDLGTCPNGEPRQDVGQTEWPGKDINPDLREVKRAISNMLREQSQSLNEAPKWCGCPQPGGGITKHQVNGNCSTFCPGGFECTNPGCYKVAPAGGGGHNARFDDPTGGEHQPEPVKRRSSLGEVKRAIAKMLKEEVNWWYDENGCHCKLSNGHQVGQACDEAHCEYCCEQKDNENTGTTRTDTLRIREQEVATSIEKPISKDAEKIADHPLLDRINTKQEWLDVMDALMDHSDEISQVTDGVKKIFLQGAIRNIGKKDTAL